jgi:hypothetical protein
MTDRYKGFLVTLDHEIREDDAEYIMIALKTIKGVHSVKPYVKSSEDHMCEQKAIMDTYQKVIETILKARNKILGRE